MSEKLPKQLRSWLNSDASHGSTILRPHSELPATPCSVKSPRCGKKVPPAKFHIGDHVSVKIEEAGCAPSFEAIVCGIEANPHRQTQAVYAVYDLESGIVADGYTERWMTISPNAPHEPRRE